MFLNDFTIVCFYWCKWKIICSRLYETLRNCMIPHLQQYCCAVVVNPGAWSTQMLAIAPPAILGVKSFRCAQARCYFWELSEGAVCLTNNKYFALSASLSEQLRLYKIRSSFIFEVLFCSVCWVSERIVHSSGQISGQMRFEPLRDELPSRWWFVVTPCGKFSLFSSYIAWFVPKFIVSYTVCCLSSNA